METTSNAQDGCGPGRFGVCLQDGLGRGYKLELVFGKDEDTSA